ncbi:MAG: hypothetical protein HY889_00435 [Deltaproteobacteria bacterium]|nr:hypothetical protein [Deltaproteobacteria bacterium]
MSNFDTVRAITDNILGALKTIGINFTRKAFDDDKTVPASLLPLGVVFYAGERFENTCGQRPCYAEAEYNIKVIINARDPEDQVRELQKRAHSIRELLTVGALNVNELAATKLVSRVSVARIDSENHKDRSSLSLRVVVRYREV